VGDLRSRIEITKLGAELGCGEEPLAFLVDRSPEELRELRTLTSTALFARHEARVKLLASLSRMLPVPVTAKIAEHAMGPLLSARVAGALDPREAGKLAAHLSPEFLTRLSVSLDPVRVEPIVRTLPEQLIVDVGRRLLAAGEYLTLGRFVAIVPAATALKVVGGATGAQLLQVALYADEPRALDAIAQGVPDAVLGDVIRAAAETDAYDAAVALLTALSPQTCARVVAQAGAVADDAREALVQAVADHDVWDAVLPSLHTVEQPVLHALVNVPATLDVAIIDSVVEHARRLDLAPVLVQLVLVFDDEHLDVLRESTRLKDPELLAWFEANAGVGHQLIEPVLATLGLR
jgi:hypothetical protein